MAETQDKFLERTTGLLVLALVFAACIRIIWPFLGAIIWSAIIVVATWPLYERLQRRFPAHPKLPTGLMTAGLALVLLGPVLLLTLSLSEHIESASKLVGDLTQVKLASEPPAWVADVPVISDKVTALWHRATTDMEGLAASLRPQIGSAARWLLAKGAGLGLAVLELLLVLLISALLYGSGETLADYLRNFAERLGGSRSLHSLAIATQTIRGVSLGVIGTAAIQAGLSAIGFWLASVPGWVLLSCICFVSALLQIGTGLVWLPVAAWLFYQDAHGWAVFTVVWGIVINTIDNFIKPYLISQGSGLPLALIFMGVLGGLLTWGFIGIFLGPTLLATGYTLLKSWLEQKSAASPARAVANEL